MFIRAYNNIMVKSMSEITKDLSKEGNRELGKSLVEEFIKKNTVPVASTAAVGLTAGAAYTHNQDVSKVYDHIN